MIFKNYIEAIDFTLCKCALMKVKLFGKCKYKENTFTIELNLPEETHLYIDRYDNITKLGLIIYSNFDPKYISILNTILKEQFNINIFKLFIPDENINDNLEDISDIEIHSNRIFNTFI